MSEVDDDRRGDRTEQQAEEPGQTEAEAIGQPVRAARAGPGTDAGRGCRRGAHAITP